MSHIESHAHLSVVGSVSQLSKFLGRLERFRRRLELMVDAHGGRIELYAKGSPREVRALLGEMLKSAHDLDLRYAEHGDDECASRERKMGLVAGAAELASGPS